jgi:L-lactate dehydrogenase (cytochrome)
LKDELEVAMRLVGVNNLSQVHPGLVNTLDVDHLIPSTPDHPYAKWRPRARL